MLRTRWFGLTLCALSLSAAPEHAKALLFTCQHDDDPPSKSFKLKIDKENRVFQLSMKPGEWWENECTRDKQFCRDGGDALIVRGYRGRIQLDKFKFWYDTNRYYRDMSFPGFKIKKWGDCKPAKQ